MGSLSMPKVRNKSDIKMIDEVLARLRELMLNSAGWDLNAIRPNVNVSDYEDAFRRYEPGSEETWTFTIRHGDGNGRR